MSVLRSIEEYVPLRQIPHFLRVFPFLAVIVAVAVVWANLALLLVGQFHNGPGDESQRLLLALTVGGDYSYLLTGQVFTGVWPPGHLTLNGLFLDIFRPDSTDASLFVLQAASFVTFLATALCYSAGIYVGLGRRYAFVSLLLMLSSPLLLRYSYTGLSGVYGSFFVSLAFILVILGVQKGKPQYHYGAAVCLLLASTFRTESIVYAFAIFLYVFCNARLLTSLAFGFISIAFFVFKILFFSLAHSQGLGLLLNWAQINAHHWNTITMSIRMFHRLLSTEKAVILFLSPVAVVYVSFLIFLLLRGARVAGAAQDESGPREKGQSRRAELVQRLLLLWSERANPFVLVALCLGISLIVMIYLLLTHRIDAQIRYFIPMLPFFVLLLVYLLAASTAYISKTYARVGSLVLAGALAFILVSPFAINARHYQKRIRLKPPAVDLQYWLRTQRAPNNVVYDFFFGAETQYMLYFQDTRLPNDGWHYSYSGGSYPPLPHRISRTDRAEKAIRITARAHQHIYYVRPRYIIMPSDRYYRSRYKHAHLLGRHHRKSYLRPYLKELPEGRMRLESPYLPKDATPILTPVFSNAKFKVYENSRANLLYNSNNLEDRKEWVVEGAVNVLHRRYRDRKPKDENVIEFLHGGAIHEKDSVPLPAGEKRTAGVWLWSEKPVQVKLQIARQSGKPYEGKEETFRLTARPKLYTVSHVFQNAQAGTRILIKPVVGERVRIHARDAWIARE